MKAFWMVLGAGAPTFRHPTLKSACTEAERLARLMPDQAFVVLASVAEVVKSDVSWKQHDQDFEEGIPF